MPISQSIISYDKHITTLTKYNQYAMYIHRVNKVQLDD